MRSVVCSVNASQASPNNIHSLKEIDMYRKVFPAILMIALLFVLTSCEWRRVTPTPKEEIANPASVYCEEQGGSLEIRKDASGGEIGMCIFPDGSECDEWAYFRGECAPAGSTGTEEPAAAP
jgi:putative hemolysin